MLKILCLIGVFGVGYELPEWLLIRSGGKVIIPPSINHYSGLSLACIAAYFLYR
jgi:hypothetical protein